MKLLLASALVIALAGTAAAQQGLSGALNRQEFQRALQQLEQRRELDAQRQTLQRQLDQNQLQQLIERQQALRQAPIPCAIERGTPGC